MFDLNQIEAHARTQQHDLRRQAQQAQLAAEAAPARVPQPFYAPALAAIGGSLINLGRELECRYGDVCKEVETSGRVSEPSLQMAR